MNIFYNNFWPIAHRNILQCIKFRSYLNTSYFRYDLVRISYLTIILFMQVPWLKIATSLPFYAIVMADWASNWGFWTLLTLLPTYLKTMLHFDIKQVITIISWPLRWHAVLTYPKCFQFVNLKIIFEFDVERSTVRNSVPGHVVLWCGLRGFGRSFPKFRFSANQEYTEIVNFHM